MQPEISGPPMRAAERKERHMTSHSPTRGDSEPAGLPAASLQAARPYLRAPFTTSNIGIFVRRNRRAPAIARVVFYIPIEEAERRLDHVVAPHHWGCGHPVAIDGHSMSCSLKLYDTTQVAVGEGSDRGAQSINGFKRCALLHGVGRYLRVLAPLDIPIGEGHSQVPVNASGEPMMNAHVAHLARTHYAREIERIADRYGPALAHPPSAWNAPRSHHRRGRLAAFAGNVLSHAERHDYPAAAARWLHTRAPQALRDAIFTARGEPAATTDTDRSRATAGAPVATGTLVEIDFARLGPKPRRWAA
jgi:hypothetical protein